MTDFDRIVCDYPLPDPEDQHREFLSRDFGGFGLNRYTITRDGRLLRQPAPHLRGLVPVKDVEWPVHGDIRMFDDDPADGEEGVEYAVRFNQGRVAWVRRVRLEPPAAPATASPSATATTMAPGSMGRPASPEEFWSAIPDKLELVDGRVPGDEKLVMLLLSTMGLRRVAALVGREAWLEAVQEES